MKTLFILPAYEPAWAFGGIVRCTANLCRGLSQQGQHVTVYTNNTNGMGDTLEVPVGVPTERSGVEVFYFPSTFGPGSVWDSREMVRKLRENVRQYDIVYVSAVWQWLGRETVRICRTANVPCVFGIHGSLDFRLWRRHKLRKTIYWHTILRKTLSGASAIHFTTEYERKQSKKVETKSFVVANGLDTEKFKPVDATRTVRDRYCIPSEVSIVLSVGRIDPKKRLDLLISAISQVDQVHLLIVGPDDSKLAREYKALTLNLGISDRVTWVGYKTGIELLELYSAADVFVLPSEDENFGMVVVEAMACGTPVLVSPYVGVWHEVKDADVGIEVGLNSQAIARVLQSLRSDPAGWQKIRANTRRTVQNRFAVDKVSKRMVEAFKDILEGSRSPQCGWK